ncbi:MAG: hypothetical protein CMN76_15540 [Spirochaetaceae bacterium]|nr:hypothetical protein [Spirochaetaceae bacterium]|tara:strand:- start:90931 stop:91767 length:837 start_codon:yes stop_codon:yes gene_type:complete
MKSVPVLSSLIAAVLVAGASWFLHDHLAQRQSREIAAHIEAFKDQAYKTERFYIENLPIYEDWTAPEKERDLRKFLLKEHLAVVEKAGLEPVGSAEEIQNLAASGSLENLKQDKSTPYYFYNVGKEYRYLHPAAHKGLLLLAERFQQVLHRNLEGKDGFKPVVIKFAISSALRPVQYQKNLRKQNANASFVSSHSYGLSFDLFYDSFYVNLPESEAPGAIQESMENLRVRTGFLLGASLRRQFRAALAETLLQLQREGLLYAIYERNQRCYHVTIIPD